MLFGWLKTACVTLKKITPAAFEEAIRLSSTNNSRSLMDFLPCHAQGQGQQSVQGQLSGFTLELRDEHQAEANIAVAVARGIVVAISRPAVLGVVVPAPAAKNAVRTHD